MEKYGLLCAGAVLIIYSLIMPAFMKYNAGIALISAAGIIFIGTGIFFDTLFDLLWFRLSFLAIFFAVLVLILIIACFSLGDNDTGDEDVVIVLGCGIKGERIGRQLKRRLDAALEYSRRNERAIIIVSGGKGSGESISEALAMERYLVSNGTNKKRIIKEDESDSTYTNIVNSKKITDGIFSGKEYKTVIITSGYHIFRASATAKKAGMSCTHRHSGIPLYEIPVSYARECAATVKYLFFSRSR